LPIHQPKRQYGGRHRAGGTTEVAVDFLAGTSSQSVRVAVDKMNDGTCC